MGKDDVATTHEPLAIDGRLTMKHVLDLFERAGSPDPASVILVIQTPIGSIEVASISSVVLRGHSTGEETRGLLVAMSDNDSAMVFASDIQGVSDQVVQ